MYISPVSFGSREVILCRQDKGMNDKTYWSELKNADEMRKAGVSIPIYKPVYGCIFDKVRYQIDGEGADVRSNPIKQEHLGNLFKNFLNMEKAGFYHNALSKDHVFFSDDGQVQIDCTRYAKRFQISGGNIIFEKNTAQGLNSHAPSNADGFEKLFLAEYILEMDNQDDRHSFMKMYLQEKSHYNEKRAEMLLGNGCKVSDDSVQYEIAQSKAFCNPTDELVDYELNKLELEYHTMQAILMWHDGNGLFDGKLRPRSRFVSVIAMLECLKEAYKLKDEATHLYESGNKDEKSYFEFEKAGRKAKAEEIYTDTKSGGAANFNDKTYAGGRGLYLGRSEDAALFEEFYSGINPEGTFAQNEEAIDTVIEYYKNLIDDWSLENNKMYKKIWGEVEKQGDMAGIT